MPGKPGWRAPPVTLSMETKRTFQAVCFHCDNTSKLSNLSKTVSIGEFPLKPGAKGNFKACVFRVLAGCIAWRYFVSKCVQKATRCVRWTSSPPAYVQEFCSAFSWAQRDDSSSKTVRTIFCPAASKERNGMTKKSISSCET